jgi:hypothetical protein
MRNREADRKLDEAQDSLYGVEHVGAWILAATALVLAILGTLVGLDVIELRDTVEASPASSNDETAQTLLSNAFWDGAMLLFSAMTAGLLAFCLHANEHHRGRDLSTLPRRERSMWSGEHMLAYLMALGTIVFVVIGLLTGFNAFKDTHDQGDGLIWIWFGLAAATVTTALHTVRHHQIGIEQDYIVAVVEERVRTRASGTGGTQTGVLGR